MPTESITGVMTTSLAYCHLNLRYNPFGELLLSERGEIAICMVDKWVELLKEPGTAIQFIGASGSGKTSHLMAIQPFFRHALYVRFEQGKKQSIPCSNPLFLDEVQFCSPRLRRTVFRGTGSLVLGTHVDFERELHQAGKRVVTHYPGADLSEYRLLKIFNRRIEQARRSQGPLPAVTLETCRFLMDRFTLNVRAMEHWLYEHFQEMGEITNV